MTIAPTPGSSTGADGPDDTVVRAEQIEFARWMRMNLPRFLMEYDFAVKEVLTKVTILREEFLHLHQYNPIEHVTSRVKRPDHLVEKIVRKQVRGGLDEIREHITDIAGIRITCSFIADTYRILDALTNQSDVRVLVIKDYIRNPKPNGYRSLHAIVEIPVFLSTGPVDVPVEVQIRTVAMDFWASLEHKIFYKYDGQVPRHVADDLTHAAEAAWRLDSQMEDLHTEVRSLDDEDPSMDLIDTALLRQFWDLSHPVPGSPDA